MTAPPTMFPSVTTVMLYAQADQVSPSVAGISIASVSNVMLAMLCSKPEPMKANRHQKIITSFAASLVARMLVHTARHTSQLHSTALRNSGQNGALTLASATDVTNPLALVTAAPESHTMDASSTEPMRLPIQLTTHTSMRSRAVVCLSHNPQTMVRLLPVNSSAPPMITSDSAMPKEAPISAARSGSSAAASGAPIEKIRMIPKPT